MHSSHHLRKVGKVQQGAAHMGGTQYRTLCNSREGLPPASRTNLPSIHLAHQTHTDDTDRDIFRTVGTHGKEYVLKEKTIA